MPNINREPRGLLDLLLSQSGGRNPDVMLESIRGFIDLEKFYAVDRQRAFSVSFSDAIGASSFVEVPAGQTWLVDFLGISIDASDNAGDHASMSIGLERIPGQGLNGITLFGSGNSFFDALSANANAEQRWAFQLARTLIVTAGQRLTCHTDDAAGLSPPTGIFYGVYTELHT